jgi:transcriptional regulator with XRE-family HTH domain
MTCRQAKGALIARDPISERLGAHFRAIRKQSKVTLQELAEQMGCAINTIRAHEAGVVMFRQDDLVKAAAIMGVPADQLTPSEIKGAAE